MLSASQWTASNLTVGCLGVSGPIGNVGPTVSGSSGPSGPSGFDGDRGPQGSQGPTGDTGPSGPSGPPGSAFFGIRKLALTDPVTNYTFNSSSAYNILIITSSATDGSSKLVISPNIQVWNPTKNYYVGDVVSYNGDYYSVRLNNSGEAPFALPTPGISGGVTASWLASTWDYRYYGNRGIRLIYNGVWYILTGPSSITAPPQDPTNWIVSPTQYSTLQPDNWVMLKNCSAYPVTLVLSPSQTHTLPAPTATSSPLWYVYNTGPSLYLY
jgi:hypothetical protein